MTPAELWSANRKIHRVCDLLERLRSRSSARYAAAASAADSSRWRRGHPVAAEQSVRLSRDDAGSFPGAGVR
jgi:hypothetical protein